MLILESFSNTSSSQQHPPSLNEDNTTEPIAREDNINALKLERDRLQSELDKIRKLLTLSTKTKHLSWLLNNENSIKTTFSASDSTQYQSFTEVIYYFKFFIFICTTANNSSCETNSAYRLS